MGDSEDKLDQLDFSVFDDQLDETSSELWSFDGNHLETVPSTEEDHVEIQLRKRQKIELPIINIPSYLKFPHLFCQSFNAHETEVVALLFKQYAHKNCIINMKCGISELLLLNIEKFLEVDESKSQNIPDGIMILKKVKIDSIDREFTTIICKYKSCGTSLYHPNTSKLSCHTNFEKIRKKLLENSNLHENFDEERYLNSEICLEVFVKFIIRYIVDNVTHKVLAIELNPQVTSIKPIEIHRKIVL